MSAFDIAGAVVAMPLAVLFWAAAMIPSPPPHPRYGPREGGMALRAVVCTAWSAFCIARLCGATL